MTLPPRALACAIWLMLNRLCFSAANFPVLWQRAAFEELSLAGVIALAAVIDFRVTQRRRHQRDESYPFIQRQVGKLSLLLAAVGVAAAFGAWFFSWVVLIFVLWTAIIGVVLFIHGLFSEQFLEWAGLAVIAVALATMALNVPVEGTRWLLISTCGVGLPALGLLLRPLARWPFALRLLCVLAWAGLVSVVAFLAWRLSSR